MKIAVCISGQLRGDERQWKSIVEKFSQYECDFFLSVWDRMGGTTAIDRVIPPGYLSYFFSGPELKSFKIGDFKSTFPVLYDSLFSGELVSKDILSRVFSTGSVEIESSPVNFLVEKKFGEVSYPDFLQKRNPRDINCLLMFYKIWSCFEMVKKSGVSYDCVVRLRSDLDISDWDGVIPDLSDGIIVKKTAIDAHVDDQFAIGSFSDMACYSNLWENLQAYWGEPRSVNSIYEVSGFLLSRHLDKHDVRVVKKDFPFSLTFSRKSKEQFLDSVYLELANSNFCDRVLIKLAREMACEVFCDTLHKNEVKIGFDFHSTSVDFIRRFKTPSWQLLGFLSERIKDYGVAISYYHQALSEDFNSFMSYSGLARVQQKLGNIELAVSAWEAALGVRPDNWVCMRELAKCNMKVDRHLIAKYWFEKAKIYSRGHSSVVELENCFE